jgi:inner membrane transporter RhtA
MSNRTPLLAGSVVSVQLGAAIAATLLDRIGAPGTVLMRQGFAAMVLLTVARPRLRNRNRGDWMVVVAFGLVIATMNVSFYEAVHRIPLGVAVTIELLGPLLLAAVLSRSRREIGFVVLALTGVVLLGGSVHHLNLVGVAFDSVAATGWAGYILLSRRTGHRFDGFEGLALAMAAATVFVAPLGLATAGTRLLESISLTRGFAVAMLSAAIPFSLELHALRTVRANVFGVIMSTSPAVAAVMGWLVLGESIGTIELVAIGCVMAASIGIGLTDR